MERKNRRNLSTVRLFQRFRELVQTIKIEIWSPPLMKIIPSPLNPLGGSE
jgi:hypothetical protein